MELLRANDMDMSEYWTYRNALGTNIADALHGKVQLGPLARQFCDTAPGACGPLQKAHSVLQTAVAHGDSACLQ